MSEPTKNDIEWWDDFYPEGWRDIVHRLHASIEVIAPDQKIEQIKEKFGGLRYYVDVEDYEAVDLLIRLAEEESLRTCQVCGQPGKPRTESHWISTLCDGCCTVPEVNPYREYYLASEKNLRLCETVGVSDEEWNANQKRYAAAIDACEALERNL